MKRFRVIPVLLILAIAGCSEGGDGGILAGSDGPTLSKAWDKFEAARYAAARAEFLELTQLNPQSGSAWLGLGWCQLRLREFDAAVITLDRALNEQARNADGSAGRAFAFFERSPQDHENAIGAANMALRLINATWIFDHNDEVNWRDLRLVLARSHFARAEYADANEQISMAGGTPAGSPQEIEAEIARLVGIYGGDSGGGHRDFEPVPGAVTVNLRVIDPTKSLTDASGLCMKGQFDVDAAHRVVSVDAEWKAPWPRLFDDGPGTEGGHEPADAVAGDHTWGVAIFVGPEVLAQQFEYSLVTGAQVNADGFTGGVPGAADSGETSVWPDVSNGFFAVAPLGGADIDLPVVTLQTQTSSH